MQVAAESVRTDNEDGGDVVGSALILASDLLVWPHGGVPRKFPVLLGLPALERCMQSVLVTCGEWIVLLPSSESGKVAHSNASTHLHWSPHHGFSSLSRPNGHWPDYLKHRIFRSCKKLMKDVLGVPEPHSLIRVYRMSCRCMLQRSQRASVVHESPSCSSELDLL
jgi:hypothetical protein